MSRGATSGFIYSDAIVDRKPSPAPHPRITNTLNLITAARNRFAPRRRLLRCRRRRVRMRH